MRQARRAQLSPKSCFRSEPGPLPTPPRQPGFVLLFSAAGSLPERAWRGRGRDLNPQRKQTEAALERLRGFAGGSPRLGTERRTAARLPRAREGGAPLRRRSERCSRRSERAPALLHKRSRFLSSSSSSPHRPPRPAPAPTAAAGEALTSEPIMKNSPSSSSWNLTGFCPKVLLSAIIIMAKAAAAPEPGRTREGEKPRPKRREYRACAPGNPAPLPLPLSLPRWGVPDEEEETLMGDGHTHGGEKSRTRKSNKILSKSDRACVFFRRPGFQFVRMRRR